MFLKKITSIYLILSFLEFSITLCQSEDEIAPNESGGTYVETPDFNNLNPMANDMSDPIIKELTKHYTELLNRKTQQNSDDESQQQSQNTSDEINTTDQSTELPIRQITATETPIIPQEPLKIDIPTQLDELNETDDIETSRKFFITTLIPDILIQSKQEPQQQQFHQQNLSSTTEINDVLVDISPTIISTEIKENNRTIDINDNETEIAGETIDEQDFNDNYHLNYDNENNDEYDSKSSSSTLLVSAEINDTSEMANEMKQNILYTDEIDENNLLRVYNHSMDLSNENLMGDIQITKSQQERERERDRGGEHEQSEQESQQHSVMPLFNALGSAAASVENETATGIDLIDTPEMLIATTTTIPPNIIQRGKQGKQGKQINHHPLIEEKHLLPHEKLRDFIEDPYARNPIAAIIDPSENVLERARILWKNALRPNTGLDIILLALVNRTALPLIYHLDNTRTFLAGLNSMKESVNSDPFSGILKATELIPYDSAVFICVESVEPNPELANYAGILLLKKRIKLYLIWFGDRKSKDTNEPVGGMLGKIAIRSGGEIIYMDEMNNIENSSNDLEDNMITLISDSFRGSQEIDIPVDTTISSIQMKIDSQMRTATLETPTGG